jgi:hypothetical protein
VTSLDLMLTLTTRAKNVSKLSRESMRHLGLGFFNIVDLPNALSNSNRGAIVLTTLRDVQGLVGMNVLHLGPAALVVDGGGREKVGGRRCSTLPNSISVWASQNALSARSVYHVLRLPKRAPSTSKRPLYGVEYCSL